MAVLKDGTIYTARGNSYQLGRQLDNAGAVIELAHRLGVYSIWLVNGADTNSHEWWQLDSERYPGVGRWPKADRDEPTASALYSVRDGLRQWSVYIVDLSRDPRWPASFDPTANAREWANAVEYAEAALGQPLRFSPGATGLRYLRSILPDTALADAPLAPALSHPQAPAASWARPAPTAVYWHLFDRNAAYLAAMQSTPLGMGEAIRLPAEGVNPRAKHAVYDVTGDVHQAARQEFPSMFRAPGWYDGAVYRLLGDAAEYRTAAYYWPNSRPLLREFADQLWQLREAAVARGDRLLLQLAKAIYTETYGNLNAQRIGAYSLFRPHWHTAIRAESSRRVVSDALRWQQLGAFSCNIDALVVASNHANPAKALPPAMDRRDKLGGYKHQGTIAVSAPLLAATKDAAKAGNGGLVLQAINAHRAEYGDGEI